eukprot:COSAG02_NODE_663_length_18741_cov_9.083682_19_plen_117_part_00
MGSAGVGALLAALLLLLCGASRAQEEASVGGGSPEPEPPPEEPEPEPEPEPKYERVEVHSGSTFFSNYDFVQWSQDKTTHGVASYARIRQRRPPVVNLLVTPHSRANGTNPIYADT